MSREISADKKKTGTTGTGALLSAPKQDFLASIVVFLVALPLCMGIAIASGVPVAAGLITGIVGGLIVGWFSGAPLQVSGRTAQSLEELNGLLNDGWKPVRERPMDGAGGKPAVGFASLVLLEKDE